MTRPKIKECARLGLLGLAAAWLLHPFATSNLYGAGDALWYAHMLADFVTQLRAGVFPIFVGQTEYAFNGAVYPLRVAPMYQYLAGLLDILTAHSLGFIALQHLTVIVCGVGGIFASYATLCSIAPAKRWSAAGLAFLYLSCPGILATIYTQDLYMTWMTVPLVPLVVYGIVRTFRNDGLASQVWLGASLAAVWWAHSPIALWLTMIAAVSQAVRLLSPGIQRRSYQYAAVGAAVFVVLAQFPFVSLSQIKAPGIESGVVGSLAHPERVVEFVRGVFPAIFLPLSHHATELSDLQLGYALWLIFFFALARAIVTKRRDLVSIMFGSGLLLLLMIPIPVVNVTLWNIIPAPIVRITYYWPMQRFYLIVAALLTAACQISIGSNNTRNQPLLATFYALLVAGCIWSLWESRQFIQAAPGRTGTKEATALVQRPENLAIMDHAYGLFDKLPGYFSNGVVDPRAESRLKSATGDSIFQNNGGRIVKEGKFTGEVDANPGILDLSPSFRLEFGRRYQLDFAFKEASTPGILQLRGHAMYREYSLPDSGEHLAFGNAPLNGKTIDLWTSDKAGDEITVRFIPLVHGRQTHDFREFGTFKLREFDPGKDSVTLLSLLPYKVRVVSEVPAVLETPRMYMVGYIASVDGTREPVGRSAEGLAQICVPAGSHDVTLSFVGPLALRISFWIGVSAWLAVFMLGMLIPAAKNLSALFLRQEAA